MKTLYYLTTICLLFLIAIITSCSKENKTSLTTQTLAGTWKWNRTDGGIAYHIHETPMSTGKYIDLRFTRDNEYFIYTNGTLSSQGTYNLEIRKCIHDHANKNVINFSSTNDQDMMIENIDNFNLDLSNEAYDGTESSYARK